MAEDGFVFLEKALKGGADGVSENGQACGVDVELPLVVVALPVAHHGKPRIRFPFLGVAELLRRILQVIVLGPEDDRGWDEFADHSARIRDPYHDHDIPVQALHGFQVGSQWMHSTPQ